MNETNVQIECPVCANPAPSKYNWTYSGGSAIRPGISGNDSSTLTIPIIKDQDFTNYTCTVQNVIEGTTHTKIFDNIGLTERGK